MTLASEIMNMLGVYSTTEPPQAGKSSARQFVPEKELCQTDNILVDMLNRYYYCALQRRFLSADCTQTSNHVSSFLFSQGHEDVSFCVCDPHQADFPIIFASEGFCRFTGYTYDEIDGRNCRFLQGPDTKREEVDRIRDAIESEEERSVNLLNYRKDGTAFVNQFFISPLHDKNKKTQYVRS
jgi:PAS domain S-box-containing protein